MSALANRRFLKMNGLGNEIVVLDLRGSPLLVVADEARAIARDPRSHFDQLMVLHDALSPDADVPGTDVYVRIYNSDGSLAGACGNGTRCVAWAMMEDREMARAHTGTVMIETQAGILPVMRVSDTVFTADMGAPRLQWQDIPLRDPVADTRSIPLRIDVPGAPVLQGPAAVSMGNPHAVFFVADPNAYDLATIGPLLENDPIFPDRANISLAQVLAPGHILLRVWERGAGITRACGSAACAALVAAVRRGLSDRKAVVTLPGGDLTIEWRQSDGHVLMTGPVELEWEGVLAPSLFAGAA